MRSPLLSFVLAVIMIVAASCSSTTVIDADDARAINEDLAANEIQSGDEPATADPDAESAEPAPTSVPPTPEAEQEPQRDSIEFDPEAQWAELAELCRTDDTRACDVLFLISAVNSDYETLASTCNGAGVPDSGWCTEGIERGLDGLSFSETSPALNGIAEECSDGDMMACDFLYFGSPGGGDWEAFGDGCGGLTDSAFPDCRTQYADNP